MRATRAAMQAKAVIAKVRQAAAPTVDVGKRGEVRLIF